MASDITAQDIDNRRFQEKYTLLVFFDKKLLHVLVPFKLIFTLSK